MWKEEWNKLYPDLRVDWRTVASRYNYHFGGIDEQNSSLNESANNSAAATPDPSLSSAVKDEPAAAADSNESSSSSGGRARKMSNGSMDWEPPGHGADRVSHHEDDDGEGHNQKVKGAS